MKDAVQVAAFGWAIWHGTPVASGGARRHDDVELVFVEQGPCEMEIGNAAVGMNTGTLGAFWAMTPHQVTQAGPGTSIYRLTVPLPDYLQWRLPVALTRQLLLGKSVTEQSPEMQQMDEALFKKWLEDFSETATGSRRILQLEIGARLHRLARSADLPGSPSGEATCEKLESGRMDQAMLMGRYVAEHYMEPIRDADIANAANLSPQYAMRLFSRTYGVSMHKYLNRYRISRACWLLATTNRTVIDIAMETGFNSMSRFYETFTRLSGQRPQKYRAAAAQG